MTWPFLVRVLLSLRCQTITTGSNHHRQCSFSNVHVGGDDFWFCRCIAPNHRIQWGWSHIGSSEAVQGVCIRLVQLATVDYVGRFCLQCQAEPTAYSALSMLLERRPMRGGCARVQLNHGQFDFIKITTPMSILNITIKSCH